MINLVRKYVFHNFGLKVVSLLAAVLLWIAVARDPVAEVTVNLPIEFLHAPADLEISTASVPQAQVRVRGPSRRLRNLVPSDVHAVIDLAGVHPGEQTFDLNSKNIRTPRETKVVQVVPSQLRLNFDQQARREVEITPRVIGKLVSGYHMAQVITQPPIAVIEGPRNRVSEITSASTDPVDASGVLGHATFSTHVYVADPMVRLVRPTSVWVTVITEKSEKTGKTTSQ